MGSMVNSVQAVEEMINTVGRCARGLREASQNIRTASRGDWEDELSQAYSNQMQNIASLVNSPVDTLENCGKKLLQLKAALEHYSRIHF